MKSREKYPSFELSHNKFLSKNPGRRKSVICTVTNQKDIIQEEENMKCHKCTAHYKCNSCNMKTYHKILAEAPYLNPTKRSSGKVSFIKPLKILKYQSSIRCAQYNLTELTPTMEGITSIHGTVLFKKKLEIKKNNYEKTESILPNLKDLQSPHFKLKSLLFSKNPNKSHIKNKFLFEVQNNMKVLNTDNTETTEMPFDTHYSQNSNRCISKLSEIPISEKNYLKTTLSRINYSNSILEPNSQSKVKNKINYFSHMFCSESPKFYRNNLDNTKIKVSKSLSEIQSQMDSFRNLVDQQFNSIMQKFESEFDRLV
jgi:hypothetical protein